MRNLYRIFPLLSCLVLCFNLSPLFANEDVCNTVVLQPDENTGKDARVFDFYPDENYGDLAWLRNAAHTNTGIPTRHRSLIDFDLSCIPINATILHASLSLFNYQNEHYQSGNTNAFTIKRVTQPWVEQAVTWNNQPDVTDLNNVNVGMTNALDEDKLDIDITSLIQDMLENPGADFGLMMQLVNENAPYANFWFGSSECPDPLLRPRLEIEYCVYNACPLLVLQPDEVRGKDARVFDYYPDENYGDLHWLRNGAHTNGGVPTRHRSLIDFDLSCIPEDATILNASLSLFNYEEEHYQSGNTNAFSISRIVDSWEENELTWNNQPNTSSMNMVNVAMTESPTEDKIAIDVTALISDILEQPDEGFGLMMQLQNEANPYANFWFGSSECPIPALRPKLTVEYCEQDVVSSSSDNSSKELIPDLNIFPNPVRDMLHIAYRGAANINTISIFDVNGRLVHDLKKQDYIMVADLQVGIYFLHFITNNNNVTVRKFLKM